MAERTADENISLAFKVVLAGVGLYAVKQVGEMIGLFKTKEEEEQEQATEQGSQTATQTNVNNPFLAFNPNYAPTLVRAYNQKFKPKIFNGVYNMVFSQLQYLEFVKLLAKANGLDDKEEQVYGVFRQLTTQWQLSLLAGLYLYFQKKDLLEYLKSFLNPEEMAVVLNMVKNYPQYRKA